MQSFVNFSENLNSYSPPVGVGFFFTGNISHSLHSTLSSVETSACCLWKAVLRLYACVVGTIIIINIIIAQNRLVNNVFPASNPTVGEVAVAIRCTSWVLPSKFKPQTKQKKNHYLKKKYLSLRCLFSKTMVKLSSVYLPRSSGIH